MYVLHRRYWRDLVPMILYVQLPCTIPWPYGYVQRKKSSRIFLRIISWNFFFLFSLSRPFITNIHRLVGQFFGPDTFFHSFHFFFTIFHKNINVLWVIRITLVCCAKPLSRNIITARTSISRSPVLIFTDILHDTSAHDSCTTDGENDRVV